MSRPTLRLLQEHLKNIKNPTLQREERNSAVQALRFRTVQVETDLTKLRRDLNERKDDLDSLSEDLVQLESKQPPKSAILATGAKIRRSRHFRNESKASMNN